MMTTDKTVIEVCHGPRCADYGGEALFKELQREGIDVQSTDCQSLCTYSPVARMNGKCILKATLEELGRQIQQP